MPSMQYVYDDFTNLQSKVILSFDNIIVHLQVSMFTCLNLSIFYYMQKYTVSCSSISNTPSAETIVLFSIPLKFSLYCYFKQEKKHSV